MKALVAVKRVVDPNVKVRVRGDGGGVDMRLNEPPYASLPNIMKAKRKPLEQIGAGELGVALEPRLEIVRTDAPATLAAGVRVPSAAELAARIKATLASA